MICWVKHISLLTVSVLEIPWRTNHDTIPYSPELNNKIHPENNEDLRNVILQFVLKCIFFETQSKIVGCFFEQHRLTKHTEEPRKKIYRKRNLGQKSYYLLSIYKLPLSCHRLSSWPVSGRHIVPLPCLFRWECVHFN